MATDPASVAISISCVMPSIVTASAGLLGVLAGAVIPWVREAHKARKEANKELLYLAILVSAHLDRLVDECIAVSFDDGTLQGRPSGEDGLTHQPVVELPHFDPLSLAVEWRVLPPSLMQQILVIPHSIEKLKRKIQNIAEIDGPPDYELVFSFRQIGSAKLALEVFLAMQTLKKYVNLTEPPLEHGELDRESELRERIDKLGSVSV